MAPVLQFELGLSSDPSAYNYCYIPAFSRYYFVKEWEFTNRLWYCYLEEDTLATWRTQIGADNCYILRASRKYDGTITDDMYPTFPEPTIAVTEADFRFSHNVNNGFYVVGIINNSSNAMGAVGYYVFNNTQFRQLCAALMNNTDWLDVPKQISQGGIDEGLLKTLFNPFQYIVSCKWFPFKPEISSTLTAIPYGWWNLTGITCGILSATQTTYLKTIHFTVLHNPQAGARGTYLNTEPFTKLALSFYPFGEIVIDSAPFASYDQLAAVVTVDCITGEGIIEICPSVDNNAIYPSGIVERRSASFGVDIQLAQIGVDKLTQAETVISGTADVARDTLHTAAQATNISNLLNPVGGELEAASSGAQTVSTATHAIADGVRASIPQMSTSGMNGNIAAFAIVPILRHTFYKLVNEDLGNTGRPYCTVAKPSDITGFMTVRNPHIKLPGTVSEMAAVNAYMEGGFYYE